MDQEARGSFFHISSKRKDGFSVPRLLRWYVESLGLLRGDFMFPRFRRCGDEVVPIKDKFVSYTEALKQLKAECRLMGVPELTMHAGRIGGAMAAAQCGVSREIIKKAGGWKSGAVDTYIRVEEPGVVASREMLGRI